MEEISIAVGAFFLGSILAGSYWFLRIKRANLDKVLRLTILIQSLLTFACLFTGNIYWLILIRFLQGVFIGILRPANQMWLLEFSREHPAHVAAQKSTYSQVFIALGMTLASCLGALVAEFAQMSSLWAYTYFALICFIPSLIVLYFLPRLKQSSQELAAQNEQQSFSQALDWLKRKTFSQHAFAQYLLSLVIFKVWIIAYPFMKRSDDYGMTMSAGFLTLLLTLHPICFSLGQLIMGRLKPKIPESKSFCAGMIVLANMIQAALTFCAAQISDPWISGLILLLGGGFGAALTYPFVVLTVMRDLELETSGTKRQAMLMLSLSADAGQVSAGVLLAVPFIAAYPMNAMLWTLSCSLLVGLIYFTKSSRSSEIVQCASRTGTQRLG